ncbi:LOW QUALITY PROTEIN: hyaluronan and proteoglycan link protein 3 [Ctenodactylus gundi]
MGLLLLVLLPWLPCVPGLPFYDGFYCSHGPRGVEGNGYGEAGHLQWLVVETPEETLYTQPGASVTLPCHYHNKLALATPRPVYAKWWKLARNGALAQDMLVAVEHRHYAFRDYHGCVRLRQDEWEVSLELHDLRLEDSGHDHCEIIDGLEDQSRLVELELCGESLMQLQVEAAILTTFMVQMRNQSGRSCEHLYA